MILQVLGDALDRRLDRDPVRRDFVRIPDSRQHRQLRRIDLRLHQGETLLLRAVVILSERVTRRAASFDYGHLRPAILILRKAVGQRAASGTGADDDVVALSLSLRAHVLAVKPGGRVYNPFI